MQSIVQFKTVKVSFTVSKPVREACDHLCMHKDRTDPNNEPVNHRSKITGLASHVNPMHSPA